MQWFDTYFEPLLDKIDVSLISWKIIIDSIGAYDKEMGESCRSFMIYVVGIISELEKQVR